MIRENLISKRISATAYRVHSELGPGLLESVYEQVLAYELVVAGCEVRRQHPVPIVYQGLKMATGFRADLLVEDCVIVEIKSVREVAPVHFKQLYTYLRLADKKLGLMINFGEHHLRHGIKRVVNGLYDEEELAALPDAG